MRVLGWVAVLALVMMSCKGDKASKYPKLDLLSYGFPIEINAPEGAEIKKSDLGVMSDITIRKGDDYYVQIFGSDANTIKIADVKTSLLADVKSGRYFSKIVEEYDNGFIFEKKIDERINYDFRYIKLQGDKEYVYQTGLIGTYTEDMVRTMYNSVK